MIGVPAAAPAVAPAPIPAPAPAPAARPEEAAAAARGRVIVELPTDAKLFVDDQLMKATSAKRVYQTPKLSDGQAYYYLMRAEVVRDGQTQTVTKRVVVRSGEETRVDFKDIEVLAKAQASSR